MPVSLADLLPDASWDPSSDVLFDRCLQYTSGLAPAPQCRLVEYPAHRPAIHVAHQLASSDTDRQASVTRFTSRNGFQQ